LCCLLTLITHTTSPPKSPHQDLTLGFQRELNATTSKTLGSDLLLDLSL
jgi:hypothetical protein